MKKEIVIYNNQKIDITNLNDEDKANWIILSDPFTTEMIMSNEDLKYNYGGMYEWSDPVQQQFCIQLKETKMKNKVYSWIACKLNENGEAFEVIDSGDVIATSEENGRMKVILDIKDQLPKGVEIDPDTVKIFLRQW